MVHERSHERTQNVRTSDRRHDDGTKAVREILCDTGGARSVHRSEHVRRHSPFADDARVGAQSAQHVALALFDKLDLLAESGFVCAFAQPSDDPLTSMRTIVSHSARHRERRGHTRHAHEKRSGGITGRAGRKRDEEYAGCLVHREPIRYMLRASVQVVNDRTNESTHGVVGGEEVDEFSDGQRDGHGDRGGDEEETYGKEERLSLGFGEGDDFAEGRAGAGGRAEGLGEETREEGGADGGRAGGEGASGSV